MTAGLRGRLGRRSLALAGLVAIALEAVGLRLRGYGFGGNVVVRCRRGHLFTTIWLPAGSLKSIRLGWWRFQRCPVGRHWAFVTPVNKTELSAPDRRFADEHRDLRIP